jgi:hypothetical protein
VPERLTEGKRKGAKREAGGRDGSVMVEPGRQPGSTILWEGSGAWSWAGGEWERCCGVDVRVAEEAEVDREEEGRVPPCGGGSGGEAAREVRRAWAWRSVMEGSGGGEDSTGRGGKMGPEAGGVPGRDRESWTVI